MNRFARLLYDAVKKKKITFKTAAKWSGVSPDLISRIILGNRLPSPSSALKISSALDVDEETALKALNYDKVPKKAKRYFERSVPKYPGLRNTLLSAYMGDEGTRSMIEKEIEEFQYGGLERLLISRILIGKAKLLEEQISSDEKVEKNRKTLAIINHILKDINLDLKNEDEIKEILKDLSSWKIVGSDYSLQIYFKQPAGGTTSIVTGQTTYEKSIITFSNSEPIEIPLIEDKIAAGQPLPISGRWSETRFFTSFFIKKFQDPLLIEVGKDQDSMIPVIFPGDLLLINRTEIERPARGGIYAVNLEDGGSIKYCHIEENKLVITCENKFSDFKPVELNLDEIDIKNIIVGEVVWIGRELRKKR